MKINSCKLFSALQTAILLESSIIGMKREYGLFFCLLVILSASILFLSCSHKQDNEAEKRIEGMWKQEGGSGAIANLDFKTEYSFETDNNFKMAAKAGDQTFRTVNGSYKIKGDSLFLYNEGNSNDPFYSAKLVFNSNSRIALIDSNGELDFSKK